MGREAEIPRLCGSDPRECRRLEASRGPRAPEAPPGRYPGVAEIGGDPRPFLFAYPAVLQNLPDGAGRGAGGADPGNRGIASCDEHHAILRIGAIKRQHFFELCYFHHNTPL